MAALVVDASVLLVGAHPGEPGQREARDLLTVCIEQRTELAEPAHVICEMLGALARTGASPLIAWRIVAGCREQMERAPVDIEVLDPTGALTR